MNLGVGGFSSRQIVDRLEREAGEARPRAAAARHAWPAVDLRTLDSDAERAVDEKRKSLSGDRGHPNEAGDALVAKALFDELVRRGLVHRC